MCVYVHIPARVLVCEHMCAMAHVGRSEGTLQDQILSVYHVGLNLGLRLVTHLPPEIARRLFSDFCPQAGTGIASVGLAFQTSPFSLSQTFLP